MKHLISIAALAAGLALAAPAAAQRGPDARYARVSPEEQRFAAAQDRFERELQVFQDEFERYRAWRAANPGWRGGPPPPPGPGPGYDNNGPGYYSDDRDEGDYDPAGYYRDSPRYQERVLRSDERVYRGRDGRYYCKRSDGTTGLIVGAAAGAVLGNVIDGGHSRTAGTLIGALVGGAAGASIERNNQQLRCR